MPDAEKARIDERKISAYLLSSTHPVGRHKRRFFESIGFSPEVPEALTAAMRIVARDGSVVDTRASHFGRTYIVDGWLEAPVGRVFIRTVWIVRRGTVVPDFVTAFPQTPPKEDE